MSRFITKSIILAAGISAFCAGSTQMAVAESAMHITIPGNSAGIWQAIDGHIKELHLAITQGKLNTVHEHAFAVRNLVRALPAHSASLPAGALATVQAQVKFVDTLAVRLDESGDSNDKAGTEDNTRKLEAILKTLRSHYP